VCAADACEYPDVRFACARVRVSTRLRLGKTTDVVVFVRLRMRVTATKYLYPLYTIYYRRHNDETNVTIILYIERVKSVRA